MDKIEINFKMNKELNFFRIIKLSDRINEKKDYRKYGIKETHFKPPINLDLSDLDRKKIDNFFRNKKNNPEDIIRLPEFEEIYDKNRETWETYWEENIEKLEKVKNLIKEEFEKFDSTIFFKVAKFFGGEVPKKAEVIICMGNDTPLNPNFVNLPNNLIVSFPRNFQKQPEKNQTREVSAIVHEIVHMCQDWKEILMKNKDMDLFEKTAACFASKGILINQERVERDGKSLEFYNVVKNAFYEGKTLKEISFELKKYRNFEGYN